MVDMEMELLKELLSKWYTLESQRCTISGHSLYGGDVNNHSQSWSFNQHDQRGEDVEAQQDKHSLILLNSASNTPTYCSKRLCSASTPELAFASPEMSGHITREVGKHLGESDHRLVILTVHRVNLNEEPAITPWNYENANWSLYRHPLNTLLSDLKLLK